MNTVAPIQSITDYLCPPEGTRGTDFLGDDVRKQKDNKNHNDLPESSFDNVYKPDQLVTLDQLFSMNLMKNYSQVVSSLDIIHHEEFLDITGTLTTCAIRKESAMFAYMDFYSATVKFS